MTTEAPTVDSGADDAGAAGSFFVDRPPVLADIFRGEGLASADEQLRQGEQDSTVSVHRNHVTYMPTENTGPYRISQNIYKIYLRTSI